MGEAFKRLRARPFVHRQNAAYQSLVHHNLLTLSRGALASTELQGRLANRSVDPAVGSECFLRTCEGGGHEVVLGNVVVAALGPEASGLVRECTRDSPALHGYLLCRVVRMGEFGGIVFKVVLPHEASND